MNIIRVAIFALMTLIASTVSAQEFTAFEGKNAVREGDGGAKKTVDGIDFWSDGAPPYKFQVLGFITDRRHKSGLFGLVRMASLESDFAEVAKSKGGDAVILVSSDSETVGAVGASNGMATGTANSYGNSTSANVSGFSTGVTSAVQKQNTKYVLIKYLKDSTTENLPLQIQQVAK